MNEGKNNEKGDAQVPLIVVDETSRKDDESVAEHASDKEAPEHVSGKKTLAPTNTKKPRSKSSDGKIPMPSKQAGKLTTAFNHLVSLQRAGAGKFDTNVENVVYDAIKKAEIELFAMEEELANIVPENELQRRFKESWIAKNVQKKEEYIKKLKRAMIEEEMNREDDASSSSSSTGSQAALEEEALLQLEQEQLLCRHELRRRQREEELLEQEERDKLQLKLLEVQSRAASRGHSRASSRASGRGDERVQRQSLPLPRVDRPVHNWLAGAEELRRDKKEQDNREGTELMRQMLLTQARVPVFKGDQLEYLWFKQSFEAQIERVTADPVQQLHRLLQCLEGEPLRLVRGCQLAADPQDGFRRAKELLNERYGHPLRQTLAFKTKLLSWPSVKSSTELTDFCIHLQQCQQMKLGGVGLTDLDSSSVLLALASKLTESLQASWQTRVVDIEEKEYRLVDFSDFVKFVHRQESARAHPVFGKLNSDKREGHKAKVFTTEATSEQVEGKGASAQEETALQTSSKAFSSPEDTIKPNAFKPPCLFCNEEHPTSKCRADVTLKEKRLKLRGLCFACLKPGHSARFCWFRLKCDVCGDRHPTVLHESRQETESREKQPPAGRDKTSVKEKNFFTHGQNGYAMATVRVKLHSTDRSNCLEVTALLDAASSATFVTQEVAAALKVPARSVNLQLTTMSGEKETPTSVIQGLKISDVDGNNAFPVGLTYVVQKMPEVGATVSREDLERWPHLQSVPVYTKGGPIQMLIGQNVFGVHTPDDVKRGNDYEPFAVKTKLGWTVMGPLGSQNQAPKVHRALTNFTKINTNIGQQLERLYFTEFSDAYDFNHKGPSQEDKLWHELVEQSIRQTDSGHMCIGLPFRPGAEKGLKNNKSQALQQLKGLERKFKGNAQFRDDYIAFMDKMIEAGHVERVENGSDTEEGNNYIPHHGVYHPQKKKLRVVFNCASKFRGVSLNDCLLSGPDLTNSIVGVLCRFRQFRVPFAADIEAMFYQVLVPERQRNLLRFLWWEGGRPSASVVTYRMKVHLFGATSSPSVANFALRRAAEEAVASAGTTARDTIRRNFYVDDCLKSVDTEEDAIIITKSLINACAQGGFKLTKFMSNSVKLIKSLEKPYLAKGMEELHLDEDKDDPLGSLHERALGVVWNVKEDRLGFRVKTADKTAAHQTKRSVLSSISQVYDPLGMASPVTITARVRFRNLTRNDLKWDDALPEEEAQEWLDWMANLKDIERASLERWAGLDSQKGRYELHVFCDASTEAYAAVAFIRSSPQNPDEEAKVSFLYGKARVTPPKVVTVPRLELTAAKLAAEIANMLQNELEVTIESRTLWTDSQTVLKYLSNRKKRFHVFVANKVESILSKTSTAEWRYVPTTVNPADEATRGLEAQKLKGSKWLNGPEFLRKDRVEWPKTEVELVIRPEDPELKADKVVCKEAVNVIQSSEMEEEEPFIETVAQRYSSILHFNRALAVWLRVKNYLRQCLNSKGTNRAMLMRQGIFQAEELQQAQMAGIAWLQKAHWITELNNLRKGARAPSWLRPLALCLQGEVLTTQTRTGIKLPIVPEGALARLIILSSHVKEGHGGKQTTAASTRRSFWIIHLKKLVKGAINQCPLCQLQKAKPLVTQMSELPEIRTTPGHPFQTTGVDMFGPLQARSTKSSAPRPVYGVIFTCAVSRAVHLEVAEGLDIASFINALRRFCARRGEVQALVCDNASNFMGTSDALYKETMEAWRAHRSDPSVVNMLRKRNITWHFIPPESPHFGGFYERLIRCIKRVLNVLLSSAGGAQALTIDLLSTLLCECESILNERPLTSVSSDPTDFEALTPNHLLLGRPGCSPPIECALQPGDHSSLSRALRCRWKLVQHAVAEFWRRWNNEYKTLLFQRSKWFEKVVRPLRIGDVVLVTDQQSRGLVKKGKLGSLGRIVDVFPSKDGEVRVAKVITAKGTYTRPITKLCLLEAASSSPQ